MEEKKYEIVRIESNIDDHNHTRGSDGRQSSLRMLLRANNKGHNIVSITDHDSVRGYKNLEEDLYAVVETIKMDKSYNPENIIQVLKEVKLLTGVELITSYDGVIIEVLGYDIDVEKMEKEIQNLKSTIQKKPYEVLYQEFNKIIDEKGLIFDKKKLEDAYEKIKKEGKGGVVGPFYNELYAHEENRKFLQYEEDGEYKIADTLKLFINKCLYNSKTPLFVNMEESRPNYKATIDAIHRAGGKAILAHPGRYMDKFDCLAKLDEMISYGLDGIEVFYPDHSYEFRQKLLDKVKEHHLVASGGSDDHHSIKEGVQYQTGRVAVPDIPETKWIKETVGEGYLKKNNIIAKYIEELQEIADERNRSSYKDTREDDEEER